MVSRITKPPSTTIPGGGIIRPMYGVIIRDRLDGFRKDISGTITLTKKAIAKGDPNAKEVRNDGKLQGSELTKAKKALKDLEKALAQLKPVFGSLPGRPQPTASVSRPPGPIAMYGVVFRDDLSKFRDAINNTINDIHAGMDKLRPAEQAEAKKALKSLGAALKDLGSARAAWN